MYDDASVPNFYPFIINGFPTVKIAGVNGKVIEDRKIG